MIKMKLAAKMAVLIALILFFTPFIMVSCSELDTSETYTGVELMTMIGSEDDSLINNSESEGDYNVNIFLIGAFVCAAAALALLIKKTQGLVPVLLCGISSFLLILFRATFISYYNLGEYEKYLTIKTEIGYVFCLIMMIVGTVCAFLSARRKE